MVGPDFEIEFTTFLWDISPNGQHIKYFIDNVEQGSVYTVAPIAVTNLSEGEHTIKLVRANSNGEIVGDPTEITITVDERFGDLPDTDFSVEYRDNSSGVSTVELKPVFQIVNESNQSVSLDDFKIRYWFTPEHDIPMNFNIDYSQPTGVNGNFGVQDNKHYLEVGFSTSSGNINANSKSGQIQTRLHHAGFQTHNQSNDFSYDASKTSLKSHVLVTLYYQGVLVWGLEPIQGDNTNRSPNAVITSDVSSGEAPLAINFDASNSTDPDGDTLSYSWDFGNGDTATGITTSYTYQQLGTYEVALTVDDGNGKTDTDMLTVEVQNTLPSLEANFTATPVSGDVPLLVSFDPSNSVFPAGSSIDYLWDFGDGNTSNLENPSHTYTIAGSYAATLTISDGIQSDVSSPITITVLEGNVAPVASFSTSVATGIVPLVVSMDASASSDANGDILEYLWDFGDGTTGNDETVSHTYTIEGIYTITLTVSDGSLSDSVTQTITVTQPSSGNDCSFGAPLNTALPTLANISYDNVHVLGQNGPDLSNVTNLTVNWDLQNNGLWQLSMSTNNGNPGWWIDLKVSIVSQTFGQIAPDIVLSGTGISDFDGAYLVTMDGDNFALVSKSGEYTIYFTNQNSIPDCQNKENNPSTLEGVITIKAFPNPVTDYLSLESNSSLQEAFVRVVDISGKTIASRYIQEDVKEMKLDMATVPSGVYFIQIQVDKKTIIKQIAK